MPLFGTLELAGAAAAAPVMPSLDTAPLLVEEATVVQAAYEIDSVATQSSLPSALHATNPPTLSLMAMRVADSPIGPISMAEVRIGCRCGGVPRNFLVGAIVAEAAAAEALSSRWGYRCLPGTVAISVRADRTEVVVGAEHGEVLRFSLMDPRPLAAADVWYGGNVNLASTPRGVRLVHVEPTITIRRADRGTTRIDHFDPGAFGDPLIRATHPILASVAVADVTFPALKVLNQPDVPPPLGVELIE